MSNTAVGSEGLPFKLVVVGGGPAGTALLVRAARLGLLEELISGDPVKGCAGIAIIDRDSPERLGGGHLQDYLINSNTHASKFYSHITQDKPLAIPPEVVTGTILEPLKQSSLGKALEGMGRRSGPLSEMGKWLCEVARVLFSCVENNPASVVKTRTCVLQIHKTASCLWRIVACEAGKDVELYAQRVVLATGGLQTLPRGLNHAHQSKSMTSDYALTLQGLHDLRKRVRWSSGSPHVLIVGGSHSAFSVVWACLNYLDSAGPLAGAISHTISGSPRSTRADTTNFGVGSITVLHRHSIKVFFESKREAEAEGYTDFMCTNRVGQVHQFGGLRGDAKQLYLAVWKKQENRVRLICNPTGSQTLQRLCEEATAIVWACGYESNVVPIYSANGSEINLKEDVHQVEVDDNANVLYQSSGTSVSGLYAVGLGFGIKATLPNGDPDGSSGRADGFAVYLKRAASLVLAGVLGSRVFGVGNDSWSDRLEAMRRKPLLCDAPMKSPGRRVNLSSNRLQHQRSWGTSPVRRRLVAPAQTGSPELCNKQRHGLSKAVPHPLTSSDDGEKKQHPYVSVRHLPQAYARPIIRANAGERRWSSAGRRKRSILDQPSLNACELRAGCENVHPRVFHSRVAQVGAEGAAIAELQENDKELLKTSYTSPKSAPTVQWEGSNAFIMASESEPIPGTKETEHFPLSQVHSLRISSQKSGNPSAPLYSPVSFPVVTSRQSIHTAQQQMTRAGVLKLHRRSDPAQVGQAKLCTSPILAGGPLTSNNTSNAAH